MFERYMQKRVSSSSSKAAVSLAIDASNKASAALLTQAQSKKKRKSSSSIPLEVSTITQSTASVGQEYIQLKITGESAPNAENKLSRAIADFIHGCGLPFSVSSHPKFRKVISLA
jgi:Flp pilus assembly protein TadG